MISTISRRVLLSLASSLVPAHALGLRIAGSSLDLKSEKPTRSIADSFPTQPPELVREMVTVAHYDFARVRELVEARPSLARASWDWGFGDWESALGAASHMGNQPIAEYLIANGARPSLFSAAMLGQRDVVKAFVAAQPGVERIRGPHSISLLAHAKAGGAHATEVYQFLQSLPGSGDDAESPISDEAKASLLGSYVFGVGTNQSIDVTIERNKPQDHGQLTWARKGTMGRPLYHLGENVFYPAGARAVRIRFTVEEKGQVAMSIQDHDLVLTVERAQK